MTLLITNVIYFVMASFIGWAAAYNQPCYPIMALNKYDLVWRIERVNL